MTDKNENPNDANETFDLTEDAKKAIERFREQLDSAEQHRTEDSSIFKFNMLLEFEVGGHANPIIIPVTDTNKIVIGRSDSATSFKPEVDLTPFSAYRLGVSRRHAIISFQNNQLMLVDLGSRNGTYLNGNRLTAQQDYLLHDEDEIRIGTLALKLHFRSKK